MRQLAKSTLILLFVASFGASGCPSDQEPKPVVDIFQPDSFGTFEYVREPDIEVPERVDFGEMEVGQSVVMQVEVTNRGNEVLKLASVETSAGFDLGIGLVEERLPEISPNTSIVLDVTFEAFDEQMHRGVLAISSNDPDEPLVEVELVANQRFPCLLVEPGRLDFGVVDPEEFFVDTAVVSNCSTRSRTTFSMGELRATQGRQAFSQVNRQVYRDVQLEPGESVEIQFAFTPPTSGAFEARTLFTSDDEGNPETTLTLIGRGRDLDAPQPVIDALNSERGVTAVADPTGDYFGLPLDHMELSAANSRDPEGEELSFTWALISRPMDSAAVLSANDGVLTDLWLDIVGTYTVELTAFAADGRVSTPAIMILHATADQDVHIQLVWDTPNDPFQQDSSGSDVDVHLLHQGGVWNEGPWDCFWQNMEPDWGVQRAGTNGWNDDPSLDIDDVDGWGPENINYDNPTSGKTFEVGVHYFSDHGYGASFATVRLYVGGALVLEERRQRLRDQEFWRVAKISWPTGQITPINAVTSTVP